MRTTFIIVEDNQHHRNHYERLFQDEGEHVKLLGFAATEDEGVELVCEHHKQLDILILDIELANGGTAFGLIEKLKRRLARYRFLVAFVTDYRSKYKSEVNATLQPFAMDSAPKSPEVRFLDKPLQAIQLEQLIQDSTGLAGYGRKGITDIMRSGENQLATRRQKPKPNIDLKISGEHTMVPFDKVFYVAGSENDNLKVGVVTDHRGKFEVKYPTKTMKIKDLEKDLEKLGFYNCYNSVWINAAYVANVMKRERRGDANGWAIEMMHEVKCKFRVPQDDKRLVPVSRECYKGNSKFQTFLKEMQSN